MSPREQRLALVLVPIILVAVGAVLYFQVYRPIVKRHQNNIAALRKDVDEKEQRRVQSLNDKRRLERYRQQSLPLRSDLSADRREYTEFLTALALRSGFSQASTEIKSDPADTNSSPKMQGKKDPIYTVLPFSVKATGTIENLVDFMYYFYHTGLLHRIKGYTVNRPLIPANRVPTPGGDAAAPGAAPPAAATPGFGPGRNPFGPRQQSHDLDILIKIESLVVAGAEDRPVVLPVIDRRFVMADVISVLRHGPAGLALVPWAIGPMGPLGPQLLAQPKRDYDALAHRNIFFGRAPRTAAGEKEPGVFQFVYLTDITLDGRGSPAEASLYDRYNNHHFRHLRPERGFDQFKIADNEGDKQLVGRVLRMDTRDLIFQAHHSTGENSAPQEDKYYRIHVGQNLEEAMRRPLRAEEVKALKLVSDSVPDKKTVATPGG
jgi:hypothetical protein